MVSDDDVAEDGVASVEETTILSGDEQAVVGSVEETVFTDVAQEVVVASVQESISISADTAAVHEGSQHDTGQEIVASVQESIPISVDEESPPNMLDAEGIASLGRRASLGDDINDSLEEALHVDVIAPAGGISIPFKFATAYVFEGDKDKFSKPPFHTQKAKEVERTEEEIPFGLIGFKFPLSMFAKWYADCFYHYYYMFDIVKYGGVKIGLSILVRYKGRSHIVNHAAVPSFA